MKRDGYNKSFCQDSSERDFSFDFSELTFDTIIVGAGITGVTLAKELQNRGINCLIIEQENIGFGTTGGTTAHSNNFYDASYDEIIDDFGREAAAELVAATVKTLDYIKHNIASYGLDCEFSACDFFLFSAEQSQHEKLDKIKKAHHELGVKTEDTHTIPLDLPFEKAIRIEGQAQFHPIKYVEGLLDAYRRAGGAILVHERVADVENDGAKIMVKTNNGQALSAKN